MWGRACGRHPPPPIHAFVLPMLKSRSHGVAVIAVNARALPIFRRVVPTGQQRTPPETYSAAAAIWMLTLGERDFHPLTQYFLTSHLSLITFITLGSVVSISPILLPGVNIYCL